MDLLGWFRPKESKERRQSLPPRVSRLLQGSFDATSEDLQLDRLFDNAVNENAHAHEGHRKKLRKRVRYETTNNPYLRGMLSTQVIDIAGLGPVMQINADRELADLANQVELDWQQWAKDISLPEKLRLSVKSWKRDGEALGIIVDWEDSPNAVPVDFIVLEPEQLEGGGLATRDFADFDHGVRCDDFGRPIEYLIAKKAKTEGLLLSLEDYQRLPASQVIHLFTKDRPSQKRGITAYVASLISSALLRAYAYAVVKAATMAANISFVMSTNEVPEDAVTPDAYDILDLEQNAGLFLPEGYSASQMKAEQPTDTFNDLKTALVHECGRPLNMPRHKSGNDSSDYNYASVRMDEQGYSDAVDVDRQMVDAKVLMKLTRQWWQAYIEVNPDALALVGEGQRMPNIEFAWDRSKHVDPEKEINADVTAVQHGMKGLHEVFYEQKKDPQREWEKSASALGITVEEYREKFMANLFPPSQLEVAEASNSGNEESTGQTPQSTS